MLECGIVTKGIIKNPGVGNYNLNRDLNKLTYSFREKTKDNCTIIFFIIIR